jgi:hypothetical protein
MIDNLKNLTNLHDECGARSKHDPGVDRHSRAGGNPVFASLNSRLRGNDGPLLSDLANARCEHVTIRVDRFNWPGAA